MMSVRVLQALVVVVILGWIFVPIYIKAGVKQTHLHVTIPLSSNTLNIYFIIIITPAVQSNVLKQSYSLHMRRNLVALIEAHIQKPVRGIDLTY